MLKFVRVISCDVESKTRTTRCCHLPDDTQFSMDEGG